jgi:hypothetical protein
MTIVGDQLRGATDALAEIGEILLREQVTANDPKTRLMQHERRTPCTRAELQHDGPAGGMLLHDGDVLGHAVRVELIQPIRRTSLRAIETRERLFDASHLGD